MKILVCGLPNSGKSWLASRLSKILDLPHHNADEIRRELNDWDFTHEGRLRQARRMKERNGILDFICPLEEFRDYVKPDYIVWMDKHECTYEDTIKMFEQPIKYDLRITKWITEDQLYKCLGGFNPGIKDTPSFLSELSKRLAKL
jgi:adenylylsulfate kinase